MNHEDEQEIEFELGHALYQEDDSDDLFIDVDYDYYDRESNAFADAEWYRTRTLFQKLKLFLVFWTYPIKCKLRTFVDLIRRHDANDIPF